MLFMSITQEQAKHGDILAGYVQLVYTAFREGGLNLGCHEGFNPFGTEEDRLAKFFVGRHGDYFLNLVLDAKVRGDEDLESFGLTVELKMPGTIDAAVMISRRTNDERWRADACGITSLMIGNPLIALAHDPKFLALDKARNCSEIQDEHRLFLCLMETARIFSKAA
jgi:hypothetical protein